MWTLCGLRPVSRAARLAEQIGAKVSDNLTLRVRDGQKDRLRDLTVLVEAEPLSFGPGGSTTGSCSGASSRPLPRPG
jgi:hypothetical protein